MAEAKGLMKPVKLKNELAEFLGATELPRTEITKKLWDYVKANKLQTKKVTDLTNLKEGQTINMMQMAVVVGANIE
jgi:chromatin remodeling complex protein RSC6